MNFGFKKEDWKELIKSKRWKMELKHRMWTPFKKNKDKNQLLLFEQPKENNEKKDKEGEN